MSSEVKKRKSGSKDTSAVSEIADSPRTRSQARKEKIQEQDDKKKTAQDTVTDPPPKFGPLPPVSKQRIWSRTALILGVMTVIWWNSGKQHESPLAKFDEQIRARSFKTKCSPALENSLAGFKKCVPKQCGRMLSDEMISREELRALEDLAVRGFQEADTKGGSSILDLHTGFLSFEDRFVDVAVKEKLQRLTSTYFGIDYWSLHLTFPTFFSRFTAKPARHRKDEYWHLTVHQKHYEHFHFSTMLHLSDYEKDFQGGRLIFVDGDSTNRTVDPKKGRAVTFSSGDENTHFVERVTKGTRYTLVVGFTCNSEKSIKDPKLT